MSKSTEVTALGRSIAGWWVYQAPAVRWIGLRLLELRMRKLELRMRLLEFRMLFRKASVICFQRGYLKPYKGNLVSYVGFARACVYHPIQVVKVLKESAHIVRRDVGRK